MWSPPNIGLKWGAYFAPDTDDDVKLVDMAIKAHDAGIVTLRSAVERCARTFNVENVDQYVDALEEEKADRMKAQQQMAASLMVGADDGEESNAGKPGKKLGPGGLRRPPPKGKEDSKGPA